MFFRGCQGPPPLDRTLAEATPALPAMDKKKTRSQAPALRRKGLGWPLRNHVRDHIGRDCERTMCYGQPSSELLTCQQLLALPGNLIHSGAVRDGVYHCVRYLSDEPLDINGLMCLRKQGLFASGDFVVDVDEHEHLAGTIQAAKALTVTLARWTGRRGRVRITVMDPLVEDMEAIRAMGVWAREPNLGPHLGRPSKPLMRNTWKVTVDPHADVPLRRAAHAPVLHGHAAVELRGHPPE